MTDFPDLKLKTLVSFPASVIGGAGVGVTKTNGSYQFDLSFADFAPPVSLLPPADLPNLNVLAWNSITGRYVLSPIPLITNGVLEAPNDGVLYGRKNLAWAAVSAGGLADAPADGTTYARNNNTWVQALDRKFTQFGTGAVPLDYKAIFYQRIYTPEMFGAVPSPPGTAAVSVADSTAACQACVNALAALGGGTMLLGPGVYGITALTISSPNIFIRGAGVNATTILHIVAAPASCLIFGAGAAILTHTGVSDLAIGSNETTFNKIAINVSDVSRFYVRNVNVAHYPVDGTMYRGSGGLGTALYIAGRELGCVEDFQAYANVPLQIATNPNSSISIDSWVFHNFFGYTSFASGNVITINTNVNLFNVWFTGAQNWIGGKDGLHWFDNSSSQISEGLYISGVKSEQVVDNTGYTVSIQHNSVLYNLVVADSMMGDRNGILLRKVANTLLANNMYDGSALRTGINADGTNKIIELRNCAWITGTAAAITGMTLVQNGGAPVGLANTLPASGTYTVTGSSPAAMNGASIDNLPWTAYTPVFSATTGTATCTGRYKQIGKSVLVTITAQLTSAVTGLAGVTLPFIANSYAAFNGKEIASLGIAAGGWVNPSTSVMNFLKYDGNPFTVSGNYIILTGVYEAQ